MVPHPQAAPERTRPRGAAQPDRHRGLELDHLFVDGQRTAAVDGRPEPNQFAIDGTILTLRPEARVLPRATVALDVVWSYPVPPSAGAFRRGQDGELFYLGYWYPQMAVYHDVYGWNTDPYLGAGQHYMGYATYDVPATDSPGAPARSRVPPTCGHPRRGRASSTPRACHGPRTPRFAN